MLQNRIQNCKLFCFQVGRQGCTPCNLQSTSVLERTGIEEKCAKIGLSVKFNEESKKCFLATFGFKKRRQLTYQSIVMCVPLDLQIKKPTSIWRKPKVLSKPTIGTELMTSLPKKHKSPSNIFMQKAQS